MRATSAKRKRKVGGGGGGSSGADVIGDADGKSGGRKKMRSSPGVGGVKNASAATASGTLRYKGSRDFRYRVLCATLSKKRLLISDIRADDESPGLRDYEASFLKLVDAVSAGSSITINETGTKLRYSPGSVVGGYDVRHECPPTRAVGYCLEPLILMCLFAKKPTRLTLTGVTDAAGDLAVDTLRNVTVPLLRQFGVSAKLDIKLNARGTRPNGGGSVSVTIPIVKGLKPLSLLDPGKIKKVRGLAYVCRCSPQFANRMVRSAREVFNNFIPDVYVYSDHRKGKAAGHSSGFGISLVAESTSGMLLSAQAAPEGPGLPEDIGKRAAKLLCDQIAQGGCVDVNHQPFLSVLMALSPEDVGRVRVGKLSQRTIATLRLLKDFFGVVFMLKPDPSSGTILMSCFGAGMQNFTRETA